MACKRKFDGEHEDASAHNAVKQMKLVPFPSSTPDFLDSDVDMSDESVMGFDSSPAAFHSRLPSSASSVYSDTSSPSYPSFDLYPASLPPTCVTPPIAPRPYSTLDFQHQRSDCKQIPKLRVACASGASGARSMWAMCEECGAIQMVDS